METRQRGFDIAKAIACVAVVLIHYNFKGTLGADIKAACRFAVPVFLMISGYFLHPYDGDDVRTDAIMRQILKLVRILLIATIAYGALFRLVTPYATFVEKYLSAPGHGKIRSDKRRTVQSGIVVCRCADLLLFLHCALLQRARGFPVQQCKVSR